MRYLAALLLLANGALAPTVLLPTRCGAGEAAAPQVIEPRFVHLRNGAQREWVEFAEAPPNQTLEVRFAAKQNAAEVTLRWRQADVKQTWRATLNGKPLGALVADENDQTIFRTVAAGVLLDGENVFRIDPAARDAKVADDIRVGEIQLLLQPLTQVLSAGTLKVRIVDESSQELLPGRLTIVNSQESLQTSGAQSTGQMAVRPGVLYLAPQAATIGLPTGRYTIYAGRGFEYSLAKAEIEITAGETVSQTLALRREVPTPGYVACDTHIHTVTYSGHGDCTIDERMLTLAGEGIEMPIATDHNVAVDYEEHAQRLQVRPYFTPVVGNEFTTPVGHFNLFPVDKSAALPDHKHNEWPALYEQIFRAPRVKVVILNHARDLHSGVRPFGPQHFNAVVGEQLAGWPLRFNAMEIVNSGATQTDPLRLFHDWLGVLNRGQRVTPIGCSDSHDVSRFIVGQARTYIRVDDRDVDKLDTEGAINSLLQGRVSVSYGLLTELTVNGKYMPGDLAALTDEEVQVDLRVLGPHWTTASRVQLFANGTLLREEAIDANQDRKLPTGVKWQGRWTIPRPRHDVHLVALASGPGEAGLYWPMAKPYQPASPQWSHVALGISGAIWLDGDNDGRRTSARDYAERVFAEAEGKLSQLARALADYDAATAAQAAHLYLASGGSPLSEEYLSAIKAGPPSVQDGFRLFLEAWRENEQSRLMK